MTVQTLSEAAAPAGASARAWRGAHHGAQHLALGVLRRLLPWLLPLALLALWQVGAATGWIASRVLPAPLDVLRAAVALAESGELWTHVQVSAGRALTGLAIGGGLGLVLGLITGSVRWAETLLDTTVQMVRNIPALALIPLVILWFGIDEAAKLFLIAVSVFFPIYLNTFHGIRSVDPGLIEMGRTYGLSRDGPHLRPEPLAAVPPDRAARRAVVHLGGPALLAGADVGDFDRRRNHLRPGRHWLPDDECARIFADRHRAGGHLALRPAGQAGRLVCQGAGTLVAALAPRLPRQLNAFAPSLYFNSLLF